MYFLIVLAAEILLAAMAVFGIFCAVFLLCEEGQSKYQTAIKIQNTNDIKALESMILQADNSFFSSRREKYALLVDSKLDRSDIENIPDDIINRVEIYQQYCFKEND